MGWNEANYLGRRFQRNPSVGCVVAVAVASVERMAGEPLGDHEAERREKAAQPGERRDLPTRPPDQAQATLTAAAPFRNSGHNPSFSKNRRGVVFLLLRALKVECGAD